MPWKKFLFFNLVGATLWVTVIAVAGYLFGRHWGRLERYIGRFDIAIVIVVALVAVFLWWRNRRRAEN
jgi:membrane protein DedA with SNARE-associated domain